MRRIPHLIFALCIGSIFSSCLKHDLFEDFSEVDPIVKIDSVSYPGDGSAGVYGHIERVGGSDIEALGIYYNFASEFLNELTNQVLVNPTNGSFEVWLTNLIPDSTYTIGCFVANNYASTKTEIQTKVPFPDPITAPCNIPVNTCTIDGFSDATSSEFASFTNNGYMIEFSSRYLGSTVEFDIMFGPNKPVNGKYTVDSYGYENGKKKAIQMRILFGGNYRYFKDGDVVYVEQLASGPNDYRVTLCQGSFPFTSSYVSCNTHFTAIR